jgi:hypothetical protein
MRPIRTLAMGAAVVVLLVLSPASALADATVFIGANATPSNRQVKGAALGLGLLIVAFEFEYAATDEEVDTSAEPAAALKTGMGNVLLQTPVAIFRLQPYFTTGGGIYRETLGAHQETGVGTNVGGGVKISVAGPLRLRLDYRVFKLGSGALHSPAHRFYAGVNLSF